MKTSIEQISPELAVQYLLSNTNNRPLRKTHVAWLADQMKNQQWKLTHQGICFTQDGALSDGQHRLEAIIASGMTVPMMVTRGAETGNFEAYDLGIGRTAVLSALRYLPDPSAATRSILAYPEHGHAGLAAGAGEHGWLHEVAAWLWGGDDRIHRESENWKKSARH